MPVEAPGPGDGGGDDDDNDFPYGGEGPLPNPAPLEGEGGEPVPEDEIPCEYADSSENCVQDPSSCDTDGDYYTVLDDATVQEAMSQAWQASYGSEDNPLPDDQRNEAMFMVLATISGYEIKEIPCRP